MSRHLIKSPPLSNYEGYRMEDKSKINKLFTTGRGVGEAESWIFSLVPVGVAFAFYMVFVMASELADKDIFLAYGATAGFVGLESYWILRGWRNNHGSTVIMGALGIAATLGLLSFYLSVR